MTDTYFLPCIHIQSPCTSSLWPEDRHDENEVTASGPASQPHLRCAPGRQTREADSLLQVGLAVQLEESDVVVQRLAVVVVVDVGGGHPEGLSPRRAVPLSEVVVAHPHVDGITSSDNAERLNYLV